MEERCSHKHTKKEYRVICEDCDVLIMPDVFDRMRSIIDSMTNIFYRIDKLEAHIKTTESYMKNIDLKLENGK